MPCGYLLTWAVHIPLAVVAKGLLDLSLPPGLHFLGAAGPISAAPIVTTAWRGAWSLRGLCALDFSPGLGYPFGRVLGSTKGDQGK